MLPVPRMIILSIFLMLFATKVSYAVTPLTCYICDDCEVLTENTPLEVCDENFFTSGGSTSSSVMTTVSPDDETLTTITESTTVDDQTTYDTTILPTAPTPPNLVTPSTTTMPPTPTDIGTAPTIAALAEHPNQNETKPKENKFLFNQNFTLISSLTSTTGTPRTTTPVTTTATDTMTSTTPMSSMSSMIPTLSGNLTTDASNDTSKNVTGVEDDSNGVTKLYMPSSSFRARQARSVDADQVTYHCFKLEKTVNGSKVVQRGCSKVSAMEDVCQQVSQNVTSTNCKACSVPKCNSSSALNVSMAAVLFALIAALLRYN